MAWYEWNQNNTGGSFYVNSQLCHRLFIQADSYEEAELKALDMGVYYNGCDEGMDCPCCGDRWYSGDEIDSTRYKTEGYPAGEYVHGKGKKGRQEAINTWNKKYGKYRVIEAPEFKTRYSIEEYVGMIAFDSVEEYAQFMADEYGWTDPDIRIFYKDGTVKEITGTVK